MIKEELIKYNIPNFNCNDIDYINFLYKRTHSSLWNINCFYLYLLETYSKSMISSKYDRNKCEHLYEFDNKTLFIFEELL